jgi:hypothetical protein
VEKQKLYSVTERTKVRRNKQPIKVPPPVTKEKAPSKSDGGF